MVIASVFSAAGLLASLVLYEDESIQIWNVSLLCDGALCAYCTLQVLYQLAIAFDTLGRQMGLTLDELVADIEGDIAASRRDAVLSPRAAELEKLVSFARAIRRTISNLQPVRLLGMPVTINCVAHLGLALFSAFFTTLLRKSSKYFDYSLIKT